MNAQALTDTARALVAGDKGLLAMDEPGATVLRAVASTMPRWKGHEHANDLK